VAAKEARLIFVGRERELARLAQAFEAGRNVVLSGNYGMGRTALLRHLGELAPERFRICFADFGEIPASVCRALAPLLPPRRLARRPGRAAAVRRPRPGVRPAYHALAAALAKATWSSPPLRVGVLDGLAKLTASKLALLKLLAGNRSTRWVVIVERFLPRRDLVRVSGWLQPAEHLHLDRLPLAATREYFRRLSDEQHLGWADDEVVAMARSSGGYPLAMRLAADYTVGKSG
jgi:hypothetical protein